MKAIVVMKNYPFIADYGHQDKYEVEEVWLSKEDDLDINDLQNRWNRCKSKTKLYDFMIANNFTLVEFDELEK